MAQRGRTAGFQMGAEHRSKIANSRILSRLIKHAEGTEPDMTQSEVAAAKALLAKVMPDLKAVEHSSDPEKPVTMRIVIGGD